MKKLDFNQSVYELTEQYPELIPILDTLGFHELTNETIRTTLGKTMTLPKAATAKNIDKMTMITKLMAKGFMPSGKRNENTNTDKIKEYLKRLDEGENLETVKEDFVKNFSEVEASEIMKAEQELMNEGTPLSQVQQLCDVHSALFHGSTREERMNNAELAVQASLKKEQTLHQSVDEAKKAYARTLIAIDGHPLQLFDNENKAIQKAIEQLPEDTLTVEDLQYMRQTVVHYAKKGDLLYPVLKVKYDITGPNDVMWTVDDEIRDELSLLIKKPNQSDERWQNRAKNTINRMEEMLYKENNILFPILAENLSQQEWIQIYHDQKDYAEIFGVTSHRWEEAEILEEKQAEFLNAEIMMPGGHMTVEQLTALLDTLPFEITFIDHDHINRYFNDGPKVFKRPKAAIDRSVFSCHPPKIEPMVRSILNDFKEGKRDSVPVWMEKNNRQFLVTYMAVRDKNHRYLGTMEVVQDMEFARDHFEK